MNKIDFKLYWKILQFNFSKFSMHPTEFMAYMVSRSIDLFLLGVFWYVVSFENPSLNFKSLLSYFLIMDGLRNIMYSYETRLSKYFQEIIQNGDISNYLIKPLKIIPYLTFSFTGENWVNHVLSFIMITVGLFILPVTNFLNIVFCLLFVITGTIIALNLNILVGCLSFYSPNADGMRNGINHVLRILSGSLIPIYLLPLLFKNILLLTPFPAIAFLPVYVLQTNLPLNTVLYYFSITVFWSIFLTIITNKIWGKSLKEYESVGQ